MVPGDIIAHTIVDKFVAAHASAANREKIRQFLVAFITFAALNAVCIVLSFELLTLIEFSTAIAFPATALFMVGSSFLVLQTEQENSLMYLCFVAALVFGLRAARTAPRIKLGWRA